MFNKVSWCILLVSHLERRSITATSPGHKAKLQKIGTQGIYRTSLVLMYDTLQSGVMEKVVGMENADAEYRQQNCQYEQQPKKKY